MNDGLRFVAGLLFWMAHQREKLFHDYSNCGCSVRDECDRQADLFFSESMILAAKAHAILDDMRIEANVRASG
jgi:hypothetical protein